MGAVATSQMPISELVDLKELVGTHPWEVEVLGEGNSAYDPDWSGSEKAAVELIESLARNDGDFGGRTQKCGNSSKPRARLVQTPKKQQPAANSTHNGKYVIGSASLEFETAWSKAISEVRQARGLEYTSRFRTPDVGDIVIYRNTKGIYAAIHVRGIKATGYGDTRDELRFRYAIQGDGADDFSEFTGI